MAGNHPAGGAVRTCVRILPALLVVAAASACMGRGGNIPPRCIVSFRFPRG